MERLNSPQKPWPRAANRHIRQCMTQGRAERQRAIVDILREGPSRTQDEGAALLTDAGYEGTQATVARDLEQVGGVQVEPQGKLGDSVPEKPGDRKWPA